MKLAHYYVTNHPGTPIRPISQYLGFDRNCGYGYDPVHRAMVAGLIVNVPAQSERADCYCLFTREQIEALKGLDALAQLH